ncbi:MAG: amino acid permease, partial [Calditrichia bacterium]
TLGNRLASVSVLAIVLLVNLRSVSASGLTEDVIVAVKLLVLGGIAAIGLGEFQVDRLEPLDNAGLAGVLLGAAVIFVAYEGFELLSFDYGEIDRPRVNLPRALYISVAVVAFTYVVVTIGSQMLVPDRIIVEQKEVAFAVAGQQALGTVGLWAATVAALFSTGSAINATLFATARLAYTVAEDGELPAVLAHKNPEDVPDRAVIGLGTAAAALAALGTLTTLVEAASLAFLFTFTIVSGLAFRQRAGLRVITGFGALTGAAASVSLIVRLVRTDPLALIFLMVLALIAMFGRPILLRYFR